ncbi:MAG: alpha-mannosidase [Armatimonadota bacterium]
MSNEKETFYFIPHTHWEGAVFITREEYLKMGLPIILRALRLLKAYPEYRFTLDQACYVEPFLQRYPEEEAAFRQFVKEGRLALVGGTDVMLDVNMPGGESFVRQVLYGKGFFRRKLGVDITVGWQLDTFGHHAQMPQLLRLAGYKSFWFFRGVSGWDVPSEFHWEGLDGSQIPVCSLPHGYCNVFWSPKSLPEFTDFIRERFENLTPFARGRGRVGLAGADVSDPEEHVAEMVAQYNNQPNSPYHLQLAVPADFEEEMAKRQDTPVIRGELNPIFQGTYSSRIELKQRTRELETLLTAAEKLGAVLRVLGATTDDAILWRAWEPMLFNQAHDLMSGVMTDHVYEDTIRGFDFSQRIAQEELQTRLQALINRIDTRGEGIPVVVFNTLGWSRTDLVQTSVGFTDPGVIDMTLVGPDGQPVPVQIVEAVRGEDGCLLHADIAFLAQDIPAIGYAVYHLLPQTSTPSAVAQPQTSVLENDYYRLEVDGATGAITRLTVKDGNWNALRDAANVVAMEADHGDLWELYRPLDGGSRIAMTERHDPPQPGQATFSTDQAGEPGTVARGPVLSEFTVEHPFGENGRFQTTIRLYTGMRRIDIRTKILNQDASVRYRVLFPTAIEQGIGMHEIPFGAIQRPDGIEFPAQNWVDCADGDNGIALLNRGLPGNNIAGNTMMLSLMRSTSIVAYGFQGGYEPGMSSDTGLELGKELTFDYALVPHAGDWRQAAVYRDGLAFNHPLIACTASSHPGALPARWGLLAISQPNVVVSTLKAGDDGTSILRVYEAAGTATDEVTITFAQALTAAEEVNLLEDPLRQLSVAGNQFYFALHPFEIKTFKLYFGNSGIHEVTSPC